MSARPHAGPRGAAAPAAPVEPAPGTDSQLTGTAPELVPTPRRTLFEDGMAEENVTATLQLQDGRTFEGKCFGAKRLQIWGSFGLGLVFRGCFLDFLGDATSLLHPYKGYILKYTRDVNGGLLGDWGRNFLRKASR